MFINKYYNNLLLNYFYINKILKFVIKKYFKKSITIILIFILEFIKKI